MQSSACQCSLPPSSPKYCFWSDNPATISEEEKHLLNKMRVLSDEELLECLEIHPDDVMDQLGREITCVTCRKVARQRATAGPDSMASVVSPITVEDDGYLRIDAELAKVRIILGLAGCLVY